MPVPRCRAEWLIGPCVVMKLFGLGTGAAWLKAVDASEAAMGCCEARSGAAGGFPRETMAHAAQAFLCDMSNVSCPSKRIAP